MNRPLRHRTWIRAAPALALLLAACSGDGSASPGAESNTGSPIAAATLVDAGAAATPASAAEPLAVVATTTILGDVVRAVGGQAIDLTVLMPPGVDPHGFEPTPRDIAALAEADLVFASGVGFDDFLESIAAEAGGEAEVVTVSDGIDTMTFEEHLAGHSHGDDASDDHDDEPAAGDDASDDHDDEPAAGDDASDDQGADDPGDQDPHVWWDPNNVIAWVDAIEQSLAAHDPARAAEFTANAGAYRDGLRTLDVWIQDQVSALPSDRRVLVTDHRVLGYFAHRYGFTQVGAVVPALSTGAEPAAGEVAALEDAIRDQGVPAIFVGQTFGPALAERVAQDTGARLVFIHTESLGEPGGAADSYLNFMRSNVEAIVGALKPER